MLPLPLPTSPDFIFLFAFSCLFLFCLGMRWVSSLKLLKVNILPLLCYSDSEFAFFPKISLAFTSKLFHQQAPTLLKFSHQSHWGRCEVFFLASFQQSSQGQSPQRWGVITHFNTVPIIIFIKVQRKSVFLWGSREGCKASIPWSTTCLTEYLLKQNV